MEDRIIIILDFIMAPVKYGIFVVYVAEMQKKMSLNAQHAMSVFLYHIVQTDDGL